MSLSTNLSETSQWLQYNGKINNISRPTLQICHTDQLFFLSPTSRPFYASRRWDWSARDFCVIVLNRLVLFYIIDVRTSNRSYYS